MKSNQDTQQVSKMLNIVVELAKQASALILSYFNQPLQKMKKADDSPVTQADLEADRLIREGLTKAFPEHSILTEETGMEALDSLYTWVVDPLDGTKAFAKGMTGFSVMIGLLKGQQPYLGVVMDPLEGHLYEAVKGQGTFYSSPEHLRQRVQVSNRCEFTQMPLLISPGFPDPKLEVAQTALGAPVAETINSVGIKVGLLVRQVGDIYLNHHGVSYWDTCAPQIILEEAGGVMTLLNGRPLEYNLKQEFVHSMPTLATNGTRHQELVKLCQQWGLI